MLSLQVGPARRTVRLTSSAFQRQRESGCNVATYAKKVPGVSTCVLDSDSNLSAVLIFTGPRDQGRGDRIVNVLVNPLKKTTTNLTSPSGVALV